MKTTGLVRFQHISEEKLDLARSMRKSMTTWECMLWEKLRREQLGVKFRRQQIIEGFIADFYCEKKKLVIEVDGSVHDTPEQKEYDARRCRVFEARGLQEIRFRNSEVECDLDGVVDRIKKVIDLSLTSPPPGPPLP
ncbi:MAG: endonuclease domain-containing protein [Fibrobacter sp.]|nr:endonuclease domain-containing protein [Fibrobacter sp.]